MPKGKRADGTSLGGSKPGGPQSAALKDRPGLEKLAPGERSSAARVRGSVDAMTWWESLTPAMRGYLVMEAHRRAPKPPPNNAEEQKAANRLHEKMKEMGL